MGKVVSLDDIAYLKAINSLPKEYALIIQREVGKIERPEDWAESITWAISEESLDNETGDVLVFNHLMTIIHHMVTSNGELREQFLEYISTELNLEVIDNDSNFNK